MSSLVNKAQTSIEFLFTVSIILLLFFTISLINLEKGSEIQKTGEYLDKRNECLKFSNHINNVYKSGPGTEVSVNTKYALNVDDSGVLTLEEIAEIQSAELNTVAIVLSEVGPSSQNFVDTMIQADNNNPGFKIEWYKACFEGDPNYSWQIDIDLQDANECNDNYNPMGSNYTVADMDGTTSLTMEDLLEVLKTDSSRYVTLYLEDATIRHTKTFQCSSCSTSQTYYDILEEWVSQPAPNGMKRALVISEHFYCHEGFGASSYDYNWRCSTSTSGNTWDPNEFFGAELQLVTGLSRWATILDNEDIKGFSIGDNFNLEEANIITNIQNQSGFTIISKYCPGDASTCNNPSNDVAMASWNYPDENGGKIFYLGDFQVLSQYTQDQTKLSDSLAQLIEEAQDVVNTVPFKEVSCEVNVLVEENKGLTGNIRIFNDKGVVRFDS